MGSFLVLLIIDATLDYGFGYGLSYGFAFWGMMDVQSNVPGQ